MDISIKEQFKTYLSNCVQTRRQTGKSFLIGRTAVDSYVSFVEADKLFDYAPDEWRDIDSIFDITSSEKIFQIIEKLFSDERFKAKDSGESSQYYRSNAIKQYYCFLKARELFINTKSNSISKGLEFKGLPLQQIFYGAPGTGKSHEIKKLTKGESVIRTTFHPDSDYSTFVGCYKPTMDEVDTQVVPVVVKSGISLQDSGTYKEKRITYKFVMQAFLKAYLGAWKKWADAGDDGVAPQFLVIEEINRGNCAQIFGDLFQLLDRSDNNFSEYPIEADTDLQQEIERAFKEHKDYKLNKAIDAEGAVKDYISNYDSTLSEDIQSGRILLLPPNLFIWATMNTSDQSLFPIDSAFKRRWEWKYMPINNHEDKGYQIEIGNAKYDWWGFLARINHVINDATNSEDKKLGYFFAKAQGKTIDAEQFVGKVLFYLWNDVFKSYGFDDPIFSKGDNKKFEFSDFFMNDGHPNTDTVNLFLRKLEETIKMEELPMEIKPNLQDDGQGE